MFNYKQYCNKVATFAHEGAIYCYTSDNSLFREEHDDLHETADQCELIYFLFKFYQDETGRVMMENLAQNDGKILKMPEFIITSVLPKMVEEFVIRMRKYILKEHGKKLAI